MGRAALSRRRPARSLRTRSRPWSPPLGAILSRTQLLHRPRFTRYRLVSAARSASSFRWSAMSVPTPVAAVCSIVSSWLRSKG
jgi:hypothetical protein